MPSVLSKSDVNIDPVNSEVCHWFKQQMQEDNPETLQTK